MAFKIHKGICSCGCGKEGIVCVAKGYIQQCNYRIKKEKKAKEKSTSAPSLIFVQKSIEEKQEIFQELKRRFESKKQKPLKRTPIKKKFPKSKGKIKLFMEIYEECEGVCMITGDVFPFDINSCMHILSHGAYERFEMEKKNILFVNPRIHDLYDNSSKEKLIKEFPQAEIIYDMKEKLKTEYNQL